jgi:heme a synthase
MLGAFGAWTVTLKLWPQIVTAYLLDGYTTFTLLAVLTFRLSGLSKPLLNHTALVPLRRLASIGLCTVILQVFLGGWTTSNYSALVCTDFPKCQTQWWPETDFNLNP